VRSKKGQCIVAFFVALLEMFFRLDQSIYAELYALFWVGPIAIIVEMWLDSRRVKPPVGTAALTAATAASRQS
jgi:enediyne biosynthesis protein E5